MQIKPVLAIMAGQIIWYGLWNLYLRLEGQVTTLTFILISLPALITATWLLYWPFGASGNWWFIELIEASTGVIIPAVSFLTIFHRLPPPTVCIGVIFVTAGAVIASLPTH